MKDVYRTLQRRIDDLPIPYPPTNSGVELRLLEHMFAEDEATIACHLSVLGERVGKIRRRLARTKLRYTDSELAKILDGLVARGAITAGTSRTRTATTYSLIPLAVGMFEMQVDRLTYDYTKDFESYLDRDFGEAVLTTKTGQLRTVPVNAAIELTKVIGDYDDIKEYVRSSPGPFGVMNCVCRQAKDLLDDQCDHGDVRETCLTIGSAAVAMNKKGNARFVKHDEILDILNRAEKKGFVIQPQNTQNPEYICCCCGDCCEILTTAKKLPRPVEVFHTHYRANVKDDECSGCGRCVQRCQMDAINVSDGIARIDGDRCIGCGLCVTTCPTKCMSLESIGRLPDPPKNTATLMMRIYRERRGLLKTGSWLLRALFKTKV